MAPALSESDALEILRTHCGVLRRRLVFDASREDGALVKQEWMSLLCLNVTDEQLAAALGYELRVAIDIVNALCACAGFSPDHNHRFWRTAVAELWIEHSKTAIDRRRSHRSEVYVFQPPTYKMLPFDRAAFSCFSIDFQEYPVSGFENTLVELWRQVTWTDAARKCPTWLLERRRAVLDQLLDSGSVVRPIRVLRIELFVPTSEVREPVEDHGPPEVLPYDLSVLISALKELGDKPHGRDVVATATSHLMNASSATATKPVHDEPSTRQELSIAFHPDWRFSFIMHSSNLAAIKQLLCGNRFIKCLTLDVVLPRELTSATQIGLFGELLRALLVETKTLKTLRTIRWTTNDTLAAVCSILPVASSLESLQISAVAAANDDQNSFTNGFAHQWEWLEYGLSHPLRRDVQAPKLMLAVDETSSEDVDTEMKLGAVRRSEHPLKLVVCDAIAAMLARKGELRGVSYEWYEVGAVVARVAVSSTRVYLGSSTEGETVATATGSTKLEAVVRILQLGLVGVVVRGCGLGWVVDREVIIERETMHSHEACGSRLTGVTRASVRNWSQPGKPGPSGLPVVRWLDGEKIRSLALAGLHKTSEPKFDMLKLVLHHCPNLHMLLLEGCGIKTLKTLVDAYASKSRPCKITSLSIVSGWLSHLTMQSTECAPLLKMLSSPNHPGARLLKHLSLMVVGHGETRTGMPESFRVEAVAQMLAKNLVLETVSVAAGEFNKGTPSQWKKWTCALLEPFQDQLLEDCKRVAVGLLNVMDYYGKPRCGGEPISKRTRRPASTQRFSCVGSLDEVVVRHILAFVGVSRVRCVRWECNYGWDAFSFPGLMNDRSRKYNVIV